MGDAITFLEPKFRKLSANHLINGGGFALVLIILSYLLTLLLLLAISALSPILGDIAHIVLIYFSIASRSLMQEATEVADTLKNKGLQAGRKRLAWIVGREVDRLSENGVRCAAVETVAENLVDGVIAPLFYATLGGAPLAMAYKMTNTLDSMVGYKNDTYREFGRLAAKTDDLVNWLPARLSVPIIVVAAHLQGLDGGRAFRTTLEEGRNHSSPNAGFPEAAFAGALGVRLGGPNYYHGKLVEKPYIGTQFGKSQAGDIRRATRLMLLSATLFCSSLTGLLCMGI